MTADELRRLCGASLTVSFADACRALGVGLTAGRAALHRGDFPVRTVVVGRCLRVPAVDLARLLLAPDNDEAGDHAPAVATTALRAAGSPARRLASADRLEISHDHFTPQPAA